jgi:sugar/nucleoside kinase (ribokinase family)
VGVLTSAADDLDLGGELDGIQVACLSSRETTTFRNIYTQRGRQQLLLGTARRLTPSSVPTGWTSSLVHIGPVAGECAPELIDSFGDAFIAVTPQGWVRRWDESGRVAWSPWQHPEPVLARADAVVMSLEDAGNDWGAIEHYVSLVRLLVATEGARGCTVFCGGTARHIPACKVEQVDPTGAGDVFSAAFFLMVDRLADPLAAARFATCLAARSVTRTGLAGIPTSDEIATCERRTLAD